MIGDVFYGIKNEFVGSVKPESKVIDGEVWQKIPNRNRKYFVCEYTVVGVVSFTVEGEVSQELLDYVEIENTYVFSVKKLDDETSINSEIYTEEDLRYIEKWTTLEEATLLAERYNNGT